MKKLIVSTFWVALIALAQMSCGAPVDISNDPNVIVDAKGIKVELSWTNTATNPIDKTDLDLMIMNKTSGSTLLESNYWSKFESIEVLSGALTAGSYDIGVYIGSIDRQSNYILTYTGLSTGKKWTKTYGPIYVNDKYATLKPASITVSKGNQYQIN